jgi:mono/diheme cytochrome c family protein
MGEEQHACNLRCGRCLDRRNLVPREPVASAAPAAGGPLAKASAQSSSVVDVSGGCAEAFALAGARPAGWQRQKWRSTTMRSARLVLSAAIALAISAPFAAAQEAGGNIAHGRRLAERWCGTCHALNTPGRRGVASFVQVARLPSTTALSLRAFLYTSHADMPNIQLSSADADDLIAFILSQKTR